MTSVLQDWVMELPLREQGTILTAIRGCDLAPKVLDATGAVVETPERRLTAFFRYCVMNPADLREVDIPGSFFMSTPPNRWRASELGHYPFHYVSHLMHAFEVVGYRCSDRRKGVLALQIYIALVKSLHLNVETMPQMVERLSEDRILQNNVVS